MVDLKKPITSVSIVHCNNYADVKPAVASSLELIGGLDSIIHPGDRVLLKVNLLSARPPEDAVTTHPSVVSAVVELVQDVGGIPIVGDGAGMIHPGATAEALEVSGIKKVAEELGAEIANFDVAGYGKVDIPNGKQLTTVYMAKPVLEADVIITLPKLKTHELTLFTGAVKSMFGAVPAKVRKAAHALGKNDIFSQAVVDIFSVRPPELAIMDGVVGMEGDGPSRGDPVDVGVIMASENCVALDMVASGLIGFEPNEIVTSTDAAKRGLGPSMPEEVILLGDPIEDVLIEFERPGQASYAAAPAFLIKYLGRFYSMKPRIDQDKCHKCGACIENCPTGAIELPYPIKIDDELCVQCYSCFELCPHNSIVIKKSLLARMIKR
ncbi:MAG: DUF362 domain-containing protein [ANME-2 cluster archaeon]|nr:DUF362 domain-containing protein [ANME-2 cluster archaeon]